MVVLFLIFFFKFQPDAYSGRDREVLLTVKKMAGLNIGFMKQEQIEFRLECLTVLVIN